MTLPDLTQRAGEWTRGVGPMHDVVVSSRVRLARNLLSMCYLPRCTPAEQEQIADRLRSEIFAAKIAAEMFYVDVAEASPLDRQLLCERHLISRHHALADHPRGVVVSGDEAVSLMLNEEDHLRMQVIRSGLQLHEAFRRIDLIDSALQQRLDFQYSDRFGFLTACPTNLGTGLRVSAMLHLPALRLTGEIEKALRAARDMRLATRGLYGEGSEASGDFYQISNQITLGLSEEQIVAEFIDQVIPELLRYERTAREKLLSHNRSHVEDTIFRSLAVLASARRITSQETMARLSMVRLGIACELISSLDYKDVNELFLLAQPAHLQKLHGEPLEGDQRAELRANNLRKRLASS